MSDMSGKFTEVGSNRITILQGEAKASADPAVEHFLLAEPPSHQSRATFDEHYGLFLMELLINEMISLGATKHRMKARLYGGANIRHGLAQIGSANAAFARTFLLDEGIALAYEDLEGRSARRVHFLPSSGRVRCRATIGEPIPTQTPIKRPQSATGDVELF